MMSLRQLRPRFTLRAMLVVWTLVAIFLAYYLNWRYERRAAIEDGWIAEVHNYWTPDDPYIAAPSLLKYFGEHGYGRLTVILASDDDHRMAEAASLFPEASLKPWVEVVPPKHLRWPNLPWVKPGK